MLRFWIFHPFIIHGDNIPLTVEWEGPRKTTGGSTQLRQLRDRAKQGSVFLPQFNSFTLNDFVLFLLVIMSRMSLTCLLVVIVTCQHVGHTMSFKRTGRKMRSCSFIVLLDDGQVSKIAKLIACNARWLYAEKNYNLERDSLVFHLAQ